MIKAWRGPSELAQWPCARACSILLFTEAPVSLIWSVLHTQYREAPVNRTADLRSKSTQRAFTSNSWHSDNKEEKLKARKPCHSFSSPPMLSHFPLSHIFVLICLAEEQEWLIFQTRKSRIYKSSGSTIASYLFVLFVSRAYFSFMSCK